MSRCELSGKGPVVKNLVSHSNIKIKSTALPNIKPKKMFSQALGEQVKLKIATSTIRNIEHSGGFDSYILKQKDENLSNSALKIRNRIRRKLRGPSKKGSKNEA